MGGISLPLWGVVNGLKANGQRLTAEVKVKVQSQSIFLYLCRSLSEE
jgi:hypothetical protein